MLCYYANINWEINWVGGVGFPRIYKITADHVREIKMKNKKKKLFTELFFIIFIVLLVFSSGVRAKQRPSRNYKEMVYFMFYFIQPTHNQLK